VFNVRPVEDRSLEHRHAPTSCSSVPTSTTVLDGSVTLVWGFADEDDE
jgi:hypothetical protein